MIFLADISMREIILHQKDTKYTEYATLLEQA